MNREHITTWLTELQETICSQLESADGKATFINDAWSRDAGGGGISRVLTDGAVIEKGGVMFSAVHGVAPPFLMKEHAHSFTSGSDTATFFATGVSIVIHPVNPNVPIIHMNTRYFELCDATGKLLRRWFGGGIDLTPHYVNQADATFFHGRLKEVCDRYDGAAYAQYKKWADDYFYITHRKETRGIGGIFFDKLGDGDENTFARAFYFWKDVGGAFAPLYTELISRRRSDPYTEKEKHWQLMRRGRYVEFNLIYDKGTRFGLESDGRIESILVSLPKTAGWEYNYHPEKNSREENTLTFLKKGIDWISS